MEVLEYNARSTPAKVVIEHPRRAAIVWGPFHFISFYDVGRVAVEAALAPAVQLQTFG